MKNVLMNDDAREKLISGINLAADVAAVTFGPNGHTVISGDHITKDGMTAVSWIYDPDPFIMMGVNLMKDISKRTAEVAGDGSTTSCILAREIVNNCTKDDTPILKEDLVNITEYLNKNKRQVKNYDDLLKIASVSANGDTHIGTLVADAFTKAGKEGIVTFTEWDEVDDSVIFSDGFRIDNGFASPGFVNTAQGTCELQDVFVYISDTKLEEVKQIIEIANDCTKKGKSLLLVAPAFDSEIYVFLQSNLEILKSCCVISPSFKKLRSILVKDMRILIGEKCLCDKVIITKNNATFLCKRDSEEIENRTKEIREILEKGNLKDTELDFHKKRLANFTSGIATIYIGGYSQFEVKEKLDRVEDAVRATDGAVNSGYLPGGGFALEIASKATSCSEQMKEILSVPRKLLNHSIPNAPEAFKMGIIEPYTVTITALENAVNIATTILTCDCAIYKQTNFNE